MFLNKPSGIVPTVDNSEKCENVAVNIELVFVAPVVSIEENNLPGILAEVELYA